jgi:hypothetical protein
MCFLTKPCLCRKGPEFNPQLDQKPATLFSFSIQPLLAIFFHVREGKRAARVEEEGFFDVDFLVWWGEH